MRIATWNVNSIRVRLDAVLAWLETSGVDALALQETKVTDAEFPGKAFEAAGYAAAYHGQKTYNGVAVITRKATCRAGRVITRNLPGSLDPEARLLAQEVVTSAGAFILVSAYFPNGQDLGTERYLNKLAWIGELTEWLAREAIPSKTPWFLAGDYNIAPTDEDTWDPAAWQGKILVSEPEREAWRTLLATGWTTTPRKPGEFSWWDYRGNGFEKDQGLRIDHILASPAAAGLVTHSWVDTAPRALERPSDHAPVVVELALAPLVVEKTPPGPVQGELPF